MSGLVWWNLDLTLLAAVFERSEKLVKTTLWLVDPFLFVTKRLPARSLDDLLDLLAWEEDRNKVL
jgi:hypothetical protein